MILARLLKIYGFAITLIILQSYIQNAPAQSLIPGQCSTDATDSSAPLDQLFSRQSYFDIQSQQVNPDFAFDLTGSSFVRSAGLQSSGKFAVIDKGFESENLDSGSRISSTALQAGVNRAEHGTGVTNLALESSSGSQATALVQFEDLYDSAKTDALIQRMKSSGTSVVNISYTMGDDPRIRSNLIKIRDAGITIVASSGNFGKHFQDENTGFIPGPQMHTNNQIPGIIYVGSISQYGTIDEYSRTGHAMTIMAPVGDALGVKFDQNGEYRVRGTSFAAPQVTAAIADVQGILPNISSDEVQELMQNSSIQTINGPMLNHLRMVEIAKKLKLEGWPSNRNQISNPEYFSLKEQAQEKLNQLSSAKSDNEKVSLLQQAYLLDPEGIGENARKKLAELKGLGTISDFYRSLDLERSQEYLAELAQSENEDVREMARRSAALLTPSGQREVYTQAFESRQPPVLTASLEVLTHHEDPFFVQNLPDDRLLQVSENLTDLRASLLAHTALQLKYYDQELPAHIKKSFDEKYNSSVRSEFDHEIYDFALNHTPGKGNYFAQLGNRLSKFSNQQKYSVETRTRAAQALGALPIDRAFESFESFSSDNNSEVIAALQLSLNSATHNLSDSDLYYVYQQSQLRGSPKRLQESLLQLLFEKSEQSLDLLKSERLSLGKSFNSDSETNFRQVLLVQPKALGSFVRIYYLEAPDTLIRESLDQSLDEALKTWKQDPNQLRSYLEARKNDLSSNFYIKKAAEEALAAL